MNGKPRLTGPRSPGGSPGGLSDNPAVPEPQVQSFPLSSGEASIQLLFGLGVALTGLGVLALLGNAPQSGQ